MKRLLLKIPTYIWTFVIVLGIAFLLYKSDLGKDNDEKLRIFTGLVSVIGIFFVAIQMQLQKNNNIITTEFLNQPNFNFLEFGQKNESEKDISDAKPKLCSSTLPNAINYNECTDIHWFDIKQIGKLPAKNVKIALICREEKENILSIIKTRTQETEMLYVGDRHQFKLPSQAISLDHLKTTKTGHFYVLFEYISTYSNIKYKRVYSLNYSPLLSVNSTPTTWVNSVRYFSLCLECLTDSRTISINNIGKNYWNKLLIKLNLKKTMSVDEWTIDI